MGEIKTNKEDSALKIYFESLKKYCDKYDNIVILNQLRAMGEEKELSLSDIYADFSLIPKDEFDREGAKKPGDPFYQSEGENRLNIDEMVRSIDRRIYELEVEELMENKECSLKKKYLYINVTKVEEKSIECQIKENSMSEKTETKTIKFDEVSFAEKIKNEWVWIRGFEVTGKADTYFIMEPYWVKREKKLTIKEEAFLKNEKILGDDYKEQSDDTSEPDRDQAEDFINGMVILSEPGGGKTTYLKHLVFRILSNKRDLEEVFYKKNGLKPDVQYFPIFIRTRDIEEILSNTQISEKEKVNSIIRKSFLTILGSDEQQIDNINDLTDSLIETLSRLTLLVIIDGFEELDDSNSSVMLSCLDYAYKEGYIDKDDDRLMISSRYKEYGYQKLVGYCKEHQLEEKYIVFDNRNDAIEECVRNWFGILKGAGQDYAKYFNKIRTTNSDISNLITTPLELSGLMMLCYSQTALPTDLAVLYRSIIEIWMTYAIKDVTPPVFSLSDMFLELSATALYMGENKEKYKISRDDIRQIIEKCRVNLRRYYRVNAYVDATSLEDINALINFWVNRNIFVKKTNEDVYEFSHREYQSFLISYAVINNYNLNGKRENKRISFFEKHIENAEDFWDRSIVFSAFMSTDLRDDIVEYLLRKLEGFTNDNIPDVDNYYLSILLQLINAEGFYFEDSEYENFFKELFKKYSRIRIMKRSFKGLEIEKLLLKGRKSTNTMFLVNCAEAIESRNKKIEEFNKDYDKKKLKEIESEIDTIYDILTDIVFKVIWNCEADFNGIEKAFQMYFSNRITINTVYEIKKSIDSGSYSEERIRLIENICRHSIAHEDSKVDCFMFLAITIGYLKAKNEKVSLYKVAVDYFQKAENETEEILKNESVFIATNILLLCAWFIQEDEAEKCDCSLKDKMGNWNRGLIEQFGIGISYICKYMKSFHKRFIYERDVIVTYINLCYLQYIDMPKNLVRKVFNKKIFDDSLDKCKKGVLNSEKNALSLVSEIIALYPLENKYVCSRETKKILEKSIVEIEQCMKSDEISEDDHVLALKLLILAGKYYDEQGLLIRQLKEGLEGISGIITECSWKGKEVYREMRNYLAKNSKSFSDGFFPIDNEILPFG